VEPSIDKSAPPFVNDKSGIIRVGGTRIPIDTIITAFKNGSTCEEIVYQFPTLKLADVYSTISYYLNHQGEIEAYLKEHSEEANLIRSGVESNIDTREIRMRILKRRTESKRAM
jgi:uncharacterized protein (DUF433 family)